MIPYIHSEVYHLFGFQLRTWGTLIAIAYMVGTWMAWRRAKARGLQPDRVLDMAFWIFIAAFIGARLFHVLFYEPQYYWQHPLEAFDLRQPGYAIYGGFIGAAAAFFAYTKRQSLKALEYADVLIWGLPLGCGIGRIGCFLIHDHPGTLTHFVLGVKYPDGSIRHDLGLYLSLVGFATALLFLWLNRKQRAPGFWFGTYMIIEGVVRFLLDFLRVVDVRYVGLTPAQYLSIPLIGVGVWLLYKTRRVA